jgi:hypothetical protein
MHGKEVGVYCVSFSARHSVLVMNHVPYLNFEKYGNKVVP